MTIAEIKSSIQSINKIIKITAALKMISVALIYKTQSRLTGLRPYSKSLSDMVSLINIDENMQIPLLAGHPDSNRQLVIVITSDRGLAGDFNTKVINEALGLAQPDKVYDYICIGKIGLSRLSGKQSQVIDSITEIDKFDFNSARTLMSRILEHNEKNNYEAVVVVGSVLYTGNLSKVEKRQLLPVNPTQNGNDDHYIFEPDKFRFLVQIYRHYLEFQLYLCVQESYGAEQTARLLAMDEATRNGEQLRSTLNLTLNKTRQQIITAEISEIVGAAEAT